jgi:indolepyruvate ferredoxin oxidoreductase
MTTLTASATIGDRFAAGSGRFPLSGVQALIRLIVDVRRTDRAQGLDTAAFVSGYEGSPLAGLDLELERREQLLAEHDIVFRPAVNEELAATAVQGTQLVAGHEDARVAGITGFWYGKSPGVDRASDALRHANLIGTHPRGGAVAFVGDDPAAKSSTVPGASEFLLADLGMPVLYPADPQDIVDLGRHAVAMSRASGLWVALKVVATVADGVGLVEADPGRVVPAVDHGRTFAHQPNARMLQPALSEMERSREGIRREVSIAYARTNGVNRMENFGAAPRTGIVAGGKTYLELRQALRIIGLDETELRARGMRLLHLGMIHPLIPDQIEEFAAGLDEIIVVEEKRPFVESAVKQILYGRPHAPRVTGRGHAGEPLFPSEGELDADLIARGLAERLGGPRFPTVDTWRARNAKPRTVTQLPLVARTPYFCSGCPHNSSTKVPAGSMVGGGIGCHALVLMMEPDAVGEITGLTQMGGEGAQWIGMEPFLRTRKHLLQNIGDGTFHHSGSLAVRAAIASGADITYKLLYNSAVAMTGGQDAVGAMAIPALTRALAAEGVRRIIVTTGEPGRYRQRSFRRQHGRLAGIAEVWPRDRLAEAQQALSSVPGVTVLIHDQECATELRRKRKRGKAPTPPQSVMINERVCEGCGDCGQQSNCLSVQPIDTDFGRKTTIDQSSCNKDFSCLAGDCPSFVEVRPAGTRPRRRTAAPLNAADLPAPVAWFDVDAAPHTTRITGVGGTGIVTVSQILAAAAGFASREVRTLDQIGLAQKGGAVVSDVKISASPLPAASKAAAGECDLYLGCDLLVAADPKNLAAADAARTVAVVSTTKVPTGRMVTDPGSAFPDVEAIVGQIGQAAGGRDPILLDARRLAVTLLGTDQFANMLLIGAAYQAGALPLPAEAIEQAIELNAVAVEANLQAFRHGRQAVADPAALAEVVDALTVRPPARPRDEAAERLAAQVGAPAGSELDRLVRDRTADLAGYQNLRYADVYAGLVRRIYQAEHAVAPASTALSEQVARYLYKLMAYKDEYEVARLSLDPGLGAMVEAEFGPGATVSYRLHPPVLRALGLRRKIRLGPWFRPVFWLLGAMKVLRGTPFDPFGRTRVRRLERELITEYRAAMENLLPHLTEDTLADCVRIAALPDLVRGYEQIKIASVDRYRTHLHADLAALGAADAHRASPTPG